MVGVLLLAALAAAPAAAEDWKGGNYGGGRQWGGSYQSPTTTDFGGAPRANSQNDRGEASQTSDDSDAQGRGRTRRQKKSKKDSGSDSGSESGSGFAEKKERDTPGDEPRSPEEAKARRSSGEDGGSGEGRAGPMSLADARENFQGVVESYVAKNAEDGVWTRREGGKTQRLTLAAVETRGVRATGRGLYSGLVAFRDDRGRKTKLEFTVDFSKDLWAVSSVKRPTENAAHIVK